MMTHFEVSYQMGFLIKVAKLQLESYGYVYPLIITLNKGKEVPVKIKSELQIDNKTYIVRDGNLIEKEDLPLFTPPEPKDIYVTVSMFKMMTDEDEALIVKFFKAVAHQFDPDAVAYVNSCLYNEYSNPDAVTDQEVLLNPDSVRVIHCCYYTREDKVARMSVLSYLNRGKLKSEPSPENTFSDEDTLNTPEVQPNFDILISDCSWFSKWPRLTPFVKYPYKRR